MSINSLFNTRSLIYVISICFLTSLSLTAYAQGEVITLDDQDNSSSNDIIKAFTGSDPDASGADKPFRTRGISLNKSKRKSASDEKGAMAQQFTANKTVAACVAGTQAVAVNLRFESNSSDVKKRDTKLLRKIAQAMNSPQLKNCYFIIEGHTNALGEEYYNLWLSQQRATSVKSYLMDYNVPDNRMIVVGKGEVELLNSDSPDAAENRRVQFKIINSTK